MVKPVTEITSAARLIQSPAVIVAGTWTVIREKGRATFTLFRGDTTLGAERDLVVRAVPCRFISRPPISPDGRIAMPPPVP
jgi:hypothetical protein